MSKSVFDIVTLEQREDGVHAIVHLHKDHSVFEGHFPGQPVLPGVLIMRIVRDIARQHTGLQLYLRSAVSIKFLTPVDPTVHNVFEVELKAMSHDDVPYRYDVKGFAGETVFFKIKASFDEGA